ncbi:hypothetical protein PUN28_020149 [Cardiocondyla obscurior]|uniref:Uncharacterized protein n=1 Tax=Cardiocondyla obscurior TaxID=286306 RepID=A0AAW2E8X5_9HYME
MNIDVQILKRERYNFKDLSCMCVYACMNVQQIYPWPKCVDDRHRSRINDDLDRDQDGGVDLLHKKKILKNSKRTVFSKRNCKFREKERERERVRTHSKGLIEFEFKRREIAEDPAQTRILRQNLGLQEKRRPR